MSIKEDIKKAENELLDELAQKVIACDEKIAVYSAIATIAHVVSHMVTPEQLQSCKHEGALEHDQILKDASGIYKYITHLRNLKQDMEQQAIKVLTNQLMRDMAEDIYKTPSEEKPN